MGSEAEKALAAFEEKMKRTIHLDILSPYVTEPVIRSALDQYGSVTAVQFIPNYTEPNVIPCSALVELETAKQAENVIEELSAYPFMMLGMPRPVRARPAKAEMFEDRPEKLGRKIQLCWVDPNDPDFRLGQKLKQLAKKHHAETEFLLKRQAEEEANLSKNQEDTLKSTYHKYEMMDNVLGERTSGRLAQYYDKRARDGAGF